MELTIIQQHALQTLVQIALNNKSVIEVLEAEHMLLPIIELQTKFNSEKLVRIKYHYSDFAGKAKDALTDYIASLTTKHFCKINQEATNFIDVTLTEVEHNFITKYICNFGYES